MGGADTTQQTSSQQTTQLPPWINTAAQQNYAQAQNIAAQPLQQYQGQLVANVSPQMQQSWNTAAQGGGAGADQYNASQAAYLGVLGQQPQQITPQTLAGTNLSPYMNPYTQSVINATLPIMQQQLGQAQIGNQSQAAGAGAYGGSRQAIQQGVTQAQGAQNMAQMAAQLNQANYGQAVQGAQYDIGTNLAAQQANQQAQQNQAGLNLQAAGGLGVLGQQAQLSQARNFTEQMTAGTAEQQQQQNEINANLAQYQQALQYPYQQLGVLQSALGMTPYGQSTTGQATTTTQQSANPLGMALGGLQSLGSLFGGGGMFGSTGAFSGLLHSGHGTTRVPGPRYSPPGLDTVPAALAPGEAVLNREAAQKLGRPKIAALNRAGLTQRANAAAFAPKAPALGLGQGPNLAAIANPGGPTPRMPMPSAPTLGPLSAPGPGAGGIGALGGSMRPPQAPRIRRMRQPIAGGLAFG